MFWTIKFSGKSCFDRRSDILFYYESLNGHPLAAF